MKVIVTGASGPLGIVMVKQCIKEGIEVLAVVREGSKRAKDIPDHPLVNTLFWDMDHIDELDIKPDKKYDVCFHFAWMHTGDEYRENPLAQGKNISATLKTAEFAKKMGCRAFIGAGSQAEYGLLNEKADEKTAEKPVTMYGTAKLAAGRMVMEYCRQNGMRCNWIRIFAVYGPYENDYIFTAYMIRSLLKGESPKLTPCTQIWDYLYCEDAVRAFLLVAKNVKKSGIYCLGSGNAKRLSEYVNVIRDIVSQDTKLLIGEVPFSKNQIMHLEADISKINKDTGFVPEIAFDEGIRRTLEWYKKT